MAKFPPTAMDSLVDSPVRYELAESTCPPLRLGALLSPQVVEQLSELSIGYQTSRGDHELRRLIAETGDTRLVSLASPQNPSGVRFAHEDLLRLVARIDEVAAEAVLLVDETYRETVYGDQRMP